MTTTTFQLKTPDGPCTTELVAHEGTRPRPAVVLFFDAGGLRPAQTRAGALNSSLRLESLRAAPAPRGGCQWLAAVRRLRRLCQET
jgi:hypothetical protein